MILIELNAVLNTLTPHRTQQNDCSDGDEWVVVSQPKEPEASSQPLVQPLVQPLRSSTSFDDCCSLAETSCSDDELGARRVSFSGEDEVHLVERVYDADCLSLHFYSCEDTQRFRQEYRLERKLLAELDVDPLSHQEELSGLFATIDPASSGRHNISHVVVLHNDKIKTFCNPEQSQCNPDDFFDNDSFWSGSITWY